MKMNKYLKILIVGGISIIGIYLAFMGEDFEEIRTTAKKYFKKIDFFKPNSSRDESRETYIHCSRLST